MWKWSTNPVRCLISESFYRTSSNIQPHYASVQLPLIGGSDRSLPLCSLPDSGENEWLISRQQNYILPPPNITLGHRSPSHRSDRANAQSWLLSPWAWALAKPSTRPLQQNGVTMPLAGENTLSSNARCPYHSSKHSGLNTGVNRTLQKGAFPLAWCIPLVWSKALFESLADDELKVK